MVTIGSGFIQNGLLRAVSLFRDNVITRVRTGTFNDIGIRNHASQSHFLRSDPAKPPATTTRLDASSWAC